MSHPLFMLALLLGVTLPAPTLSSSGHEDPRLGFKMSTPKKWNQVPIQNDERWIVGRYQSNKANHFIDKGTGWSFDHKPELTMIAFTGEGLETDVELGGDESKGKTISATLRIENPYKNYREYLQKTYSGGGWFVDEETEKTIHAIAVTAYEIKVEKSSYDGPKHIKTWVYHLGHADVAVQFECLESAYVKLNKEFESRLKSFSTIERTEVVNASSFGLKEILSSADSPAERKKIRLSIEKEQHDKAQANLPEDWTAEDVGRFLVLSHVKKKHTKAVTNQVGKMFDWLADEFPYIGSEEYVRRPIIRICESSEELSLFVSGSGWSFTNIEILTCRDTGGYSNYYRGYVNDRSFRYWFDERDRELYMRIPAWLKSGMDRMLHSARVKGSRLIFEPDQWEKTGLREAVREGTVTLPSRMLRMTYDDWGDSETIYREVGAFTRYLLAGKGAKGKLTKGLVERYLKNLKDILDEEKAAEDASDDEDGDDDPLTEEEEDAAFKSRQNAWKEKAEAIAEAVFQRTFADWTDKDWDALDKAYLKTIK